MLRRWRRAVAHLYGVASKKMDECPGRDGLSQLVPRRNCSKVAATPAPDSVPRGSLPKTNVNLLLTKWMKDLEKIFYGNIVAYDAAMSPEARNDDLLNVIWRNIFADDGSPMPNGAAADAVKALSRYTRRESTCLSLTDKEAIFSGNFMFTSLENQISRSELSLKR
uniref:DNA-directed RNA polymerase subunit beta n=1 Tax=Anthurium amnicola TaxID=1678845 RepID=A0A1D1ZKC1_9ARAE